MAAPGFAQAPATLANLAHLTPRPVKGLFGDNYLSMADLDFTQQFLPEVYEKEVERYGNRTITGFLRMVGAEMPMASDRVVWSEQGRLHIAYDNAESNAPVVVGTQTIGLPSPQPAGSAQAGQAPLLGAGQTIVIALGNVTNKAYIVSEGALAGGIQTYNIEVYDTDDKNLDPALQDAGSAGQPNLLSLFVFGSEYQKGSPEGGVSVDASFTSFNNKPIILRDKYEVNGSDVAQIGWVEVTTEIGTGGYLWYLKSEHESRIRFEDYLEMSMVEATESAAERGVAGAAAMTNAAGNAITGMQGLFATLEERGLVYNDPDFSAPVVPGPSGIDQFDQILQELDKQGAIEENMLFLDRQTSLDIDSMLAQQNSYGAGGTSYGVFENSEEMALNLGFSGFRRGAYDFYKTDWKYLNDATTRGLIDDIKGVLVPAGTSTVYDQQLGQNISRPFLHIRYRASEADDRRMKSWITGSVGGNYTSNADTMTVNFLSERTMCTQAANNFVLFKAT